ncbi:peptidoglycan DD-metalloendopeptidase family protein [Pseudomonas sp.]|uniref:peptidoglycan DD-metalloendopeptidase family protein n=1 Tax=Pseudomonas sp. TaxID=306 RepID=UPI003CC6987D
MQLRSLLFCALALGFTQAGATTIYKYTDAYGVTSYTDRPTHGAKVLIFADRMTERLDQQVHLDVNKQAGVTTFSARNELYAPVEVELRLSSLGNVRAGTPAVVRRVLPARSTVALTTLVAQKPGQALRFTQKFRYSLGNPSMVAMGYRYPLPWVGGPFRLTQGPNGTFSHFGPKSRWAMDIAMPVGTPIIAARGGTVVKVENDQGSGGSNPSGNFVRILHDDGTMGVYLHLMQGSVSVLEGQHVAVGTPLARSGNTGNSTGPHLHFVVQRNVGLGLESIPFQFNQPVGSLPNFALGNK